MCAEQFILRWHYHDVTLLKNLPFLYDTNFLTDVTISIGSQCVKAHRLVLAMCSVYFFQLFQEMENAQHPVIVLNNVDLDDIKALLAFIYRGQCVVSKKQLPSFLSVAKLLKIQGLCDMKVPEIDKKKPPPSSTSINENGNNNNQIKDENKSPLVWASPSTPSPPIPLPPPPPPPPLFTDNTTMITQRKLPPNKDASETCKCFLCGKYLSNQYNLRVHMETHEETYHACQSCPHVSRSRDALRKHVSYRHPEEYQTRKRKKPDQD